MLAAATDNAIVQESNIRGHSGKLCSTSCAYTEKHLQYVIDRFTQNGLRPKSKLYFGSPEQALQSLEDPRLTTEDLNEAMTANVCDAARERCARNFARPIHYQYQEVHGIFKPFRRAVKDVCFQCMVDGEPLDEL